MCLVSRLLNRFLLYKTLQYASHMYKSIFEVLLLLNIGSCKKRITIFREYYDWFDIAVYPVRLYLI
jgi:hypothetical protein